MKIAKCVTTEKLRYGDPVCLVKRKWWQIWLKPRIKKVTT